MARRSGILWASLRLASGAITEDLWPMNYTAVYNIYGTVPAVKDHKLTLEPGHKVPSWLSGEYYINGAGQFEWGDEEYMGWMDGAGTISRLTINNGEELSFDRKYIECNAYKQNSEAGEIVITEPSTYGEPKDLVEPGTRDAAAAAIRLDYYNTHISDNTIVKIHELYGYLISFSETPGFNVIDRETLETVGSYDIGVGPNLPPDTVCITQTAHGFIDEDLGVFWNSATCLYTPPEGGAPTTYFYAQKWHNIFKTVNPDEILGLIEYGEAIQTNEKAQMHPDDPNQDYIPYFHQPALTKDYFIMPFLSIEMTSAACIFGAVSHAQSYIDCIQVNRNLDGIFVVLDKTNMKEVARFGTDYYVCLHIINSFQVSDNELHIDAMFLARKDGNPFGVFMFDVVNATGQAQIDNYHETLLETIPGKIILDLNAATGDYNLKPVRKVMFFDDATDNDEWPGYMTAGADFPHTRPDGWLNPDYDIFYSNGLGAMYTDRIYRTEISTLDRKLWFEPGHINLEVAVALSPDNSESVVISLASPMVATEETPAVFIVFLDGDTLAELGRAYFPEGFKFVASAHTTFLPTASESPTTVEPTTTESTTTEPTTVEPTTVEPTTTESTTTELTTTEPTTTEPATTKPTTDDPTTVDPATAGSDLAFGISNLIVLICLYVSW